ncbi:MAG: hypothetical protein OEZ06_12780 [Myxococcales bacterium]|nr:hypothetical protein [Myxococcales bacterium]
MDGKRKCECEWGYTERDCGTRDGSHFDQGQPYVLDACTETERVQGPCKPTIGDGVVRVHNTGVTGESRDSCIEGYLPAEGEWFDPGSSTG